MVIEISVAVIAVAFVILVIYLIVMMTALRVTLRQVNFTLIEGRKHLEDVSVEVKKVIALTHEVSADLKGKMESLDSVFNSVDNMGEILEQKTAALKCDILEQKTAALKAEQRLQTPELNRVADVLELATLGVRLWQNLKKRR